MKEAETSTDKRIKEMKRWKEVISASPAESHIRSDHSFRNAQHYKRAGCCESFPSAFSLCILAPLTLHPCTLGDQCISMNLTLAQSQCERHTCGYRSILWRRWQHRGMYYVVTICQSPGSPLPNPDTRCRTALSYSAWATRTNCSKSALVVRIYLEFELTEC